MPDLTVRACHRIFVLSAGFSLGNILVAQGQTPTVPDTAPQVVLDPAGNLVSAFGVCLAYGQPSAADRYPTYTSVVAHPDGAILALRPDLAVDALKLETAAAPATSPEKSGKE